MAERGNPSVGVSSDVLVDIRNVSKRFGDFVALDDVSISIRKGEFFSLLGPSGCGKTTLLRIIAGLDFATSGCVYIGGVDATDIPAYKRPVNTVFQSYALFPHLTVEQNVGFGLRMKGISQKEIDERVAKIMELVQIGIFAKRKPSQLSGGQRQRVALARAVVNEPQVLLLDEPLGALDLKLRHELQVELMSLQRRLGITFVCVTHDQEEALVMSDRIAVVNHGKIEQLGEAEELYERPRTRFVSNFLGTSNLFDATVVDRSSTGCNVQTKLGSMRLEFGHEAPAATSRERFTLAIRPEKVNLSDTRPNSADNIFEMEVAQLIYVGSESHHRLVSNDCTITAEMMNSGPGCSGFDPGRKVFAHFPPRSFIVLED